MQGLSSVLQSYILPLWLYYQEVVASAVYFKMDVCLKRLGWAFLLFTEIFLRKLRNRWGAEGKLWRRRKMVNQHTTIIPAALIVPTDLSPQQVSYFKKLLLLQKAFLVHIPDKYIHTLQKLWDKKQLLLKIETDHRRVNL